MRLICFDLDVHISTIFVSLSALAQLLFFNHRTKDLANEEMTE
jgi:hypothetical protein